MWVGFFQGLEICSLPAHLSLQVTSCPRQRPSFSCIMLSPVLGTGPPNKHVKKPAKGREGIRTQASPGVLQPPLAQHLPP